MSAHGSVTGIYDWLYDVVILSARTRQSASLFRALSSAAEVSSPRVIEYSTMLPCLMSAVCGQACICQFVNMRSARLMPPPFSCSTQDML